MAWFSASRERVMVSLAQPDASAIAKAPPQKAVIDFVMMRE
jgi:hypothetical protein